MFSLLRRRTPKEPPKMTSVVVTTLYSTARSMWSSSAASSMVMSRVINLSRLKRLAMVSDETDEEGAHWSMRRASRSTSRYICIKWVLMFLLMPWSGGLVRGMELGDKKKSLTLAWSMSGWERASPRSRTIWRFWRQKRQSSFYMFEADD